MIDFRCWHCHRRYMLPEQRIGETLTCSCKNLLRVPKHNYGKCRVKTITDRIVEVVLYGGGGAFLGLGLALLIMSRWRGLILRGWVIIVGFILAGFVAGSLGGERGLDWIGRLIREREKR